ncbi:segregation/condensation protein A [Ornithinibacillus bavariensis]|uniref:Segregation and condensation protein A n=1 Tax=Ornithinibacillus bavariensis TaxID=545502 RepID=A0A920C9F8_9BACI|nr:segregation/condensation protein A [Ornithinibacillus bavariensis]GIO28497.1 segregation and condensation protein A [Ornithinibacillus bavariensis]HAM81224.1 segregation/condensation protein A [Ornithinibacillus sp.]
MNQAYQVKIESFEGPLDLLLHLINHYEIDIYDIPVAQITEQYMNYIHTMQHLELNIASEYLVMAATLLAIKSQMLLPKQEIEEEMEEYMEDPREELMQRLIEYRKFKEAAEVFKEKEIEANQIFTRPPVIFEDLPIEKTVVQGDISIYDMLGALGKMLERKKWKEPLETKIHKAEIPIEQRMEEVLDSVKRSRKKGITFDELFTHRTKSHIVVTFMAILELMKVNQITCKQEKHFDTLYVYYSGDDV